MASPSCLGQTDRFSTRALFGHADSSQTCRGWAKQRDEYGASRAPITCVSHGHMAELRAVDRPRLLPRRSRLDAGGSASQSRLTSFSDALLCRYSCPQCWPNENERPQAGTNHLGWSRSGARDSRAHASVTHVKSISLVGHRFYRQEQVSHRRRARRLWERLFRRALQISGNDFSVTVEDLPVVAPNENGAACRCRTARFRKPSRTSRRLHRCGQRPADPCR
ncbi:hypothetical protein ACVWZ3_010653 [Bradyrhizobium sp. i1.3.6]